MNVRDGDWDLRPDPARHKYLHGEYLHGEFSSEYLRYQRALPEELVLFSNDIAQPSGLGPGIVV